MEVQRSPLAAPPGTVAGRTAALLATAEWAQRASRRSGRAGRSGCVGFRGRRVGSGEAAGAAGGAAGAGGGGAGGHDVVISDPGSEGDGKITINLTRQPELTDLGNPGASSSPSSDHAVLPVHGTNHRLELLEEPTAPGVWVYVPKQYVDGDRRPGSS